MAPDNVVGILGASFHEVAHERVLSHPTRHKIRARQRDGGASDIFAPSGEEVEFCNRGAVDEVVSAL